MTTFDNRGNSFENKFSHDQQLLFRAEARACKLFGIWVAGELGLTGDAVTNYSHDLVVANLDEPGLDDVIDKVEKDLTAKGLMRIRADLTAQLKAFHAQAKEQIMHEIKVE